MRSRYKLGALLSMGMVLWGCQNGEAPLKNTKQDPILQKRDELKMSVLNGSRLELPRYFSLKRLKELVEKDNLQEASRYVNQALQVGVNVPALHFINGLVYEERARRGDTSCAGLAGVAYSSAYTLAPSQGAYAYLCGCQELQNKRYAQAQKYLSDALLTKPRDANILYALAYASYYLQDLPVAASVIQKAIQLDPKNSVFNRAGAVIFAACAKFDKAQECFKHYVASVESDDPDIAGVRTRIEDWKRIYAQVRLQKAALMGEEAEGARYNQKYHNDSHDFLTSEDSDHFKTTHNAQKKEDDHKKEVAEAVPLPDITFDCFFLRSTETMLTTKGQNIMDALQISLGGGKDALLNLTRTLSGTIPSSAITGGWTKTFLFAVDPANILYSLNIANVSSTVIEVVARPTITTLLGTPTYSIQGDQYAGSTGGSSGSTTVSVDAGVKVQILPISISADGVITLDVTLEGSLFLNNPNLSIGISSQLLSLSKSKLSTTVKARSGQTVFIGGINTVNRGSVRSGFPGLQDIPLLQYFFSNERTQRTALNAMYLITPRWHETVNKKEQNGPSKTEQKLQKRGLMAIGEYNALYYILKHLESSPMFQNFRSGDVLAPFWGYGTNTLTEKLDQIESFLYY